MAFGSYGWSGGAAEQAREMLQETGLEIVGDTISCRYRPDDNILQACRKAGRELAEKAKKVCP